MEAKIRWVSSLGLHACCVNLAVDVSTCSLGQSGSRGREYGWCYLSRFQIANSSVERSSAGVSVAAWKGF